MRQTSILGAALAFASAGLAAAQNLFDVNRLPPARAELLWHPPRPAAEAAPKPGPAPDAAPPKTPPSPAAPADPPMARALAGGIQLSKEQLALLRRSPGPDFKRPKDAPDLTPIASVVLHAAKGDATATIELFRGPQGEYLARKPGEERLRTLKPEPLALLAAAPGEWAPYTGPWSHAPQPLAPGVATDLPRDLLRPAWIRLDDHTILDRGLRPARFLVAPAACELGDATFRLRPPTNYSPRSPVGLLVWIDPSPSGAPPSVLFQACDELGLAVVGASKSGNECGTGDRTQRALDALASAEALLHIDRSRVYVTGLSGGGRMSGILAGCFPDLFAGAVSMAGVAHYEDKTNDLGKIWPAYFLRPSAKRWDLYKSHRLAATTGPKDFNHEQTLVVMGMQKDAGLDARVFTFDDIGHQTPDSAGFADALRWVDEPARAAAEQRAKLGQRLLQALDDKPPAGDARADLLKIMDQAPWTPAAWTAAERLGLAPRP